MKTKNGKKNEKKTRYRGAGRVSLPVFVPLPTRYFETQKKKKKEKEGQQKRFGLKTATKKTR